MRILLTTDFSKAARSAYPAAVRFSRSDEPCALSLLHVLDEVIYNRARPPLSLEEHRARLRRIAETHLGEELDAIRALGGRELRACALVGHPAERILAEATAWGADAVVIATQGSGGIERLVLGSVTEETLRRSTVPVLAVPSSHACDESFEARRILYPTGADELGARGMRHVAHLARVLGSEVTVVHVTREHVTAELRSSIEALVIERLPASLSVRVELLESPGIAKGVLRCAEDTGAHLIAMPSHGRRGLARWLLGSVAEDVIRDARLPVYVFR